MWGRGAAWLAHRPVKPKVAGSSPVGPAKNKGYQLRIALFSININMALLKMSDDEYFTIEQQQKAEIKIKGSRFIGTAYPALSEIQAKNVITQISKQYFDASHNCYAYNVGFGSTKISRFNDAGEPSGTAGQPIMNVIHGKNLTNIVLIVTRYFGGTKLGKGGLIRAYSECAQEVLIKCRIIKKYLYKTINLKFDYDLTGPTMRIISQYNIKILNSTYGQQTELKISIRQSFVENFKQDLTELTSGKVIIFREK